MPTFWVPSKRQATTEIRDALADGQGWVGGTSPPPTPSSSLTGTSHPIKDEEGVPDRPSLGSGRRFLRLEEREGLERKIPSNGLSHSAGVGDLGFGAHGPEGESFDFAKCVTSGQVFRWERLPDGRWLGVDGTSWFLVAVGRDRVSVESNAEAETFRRVFRLDEDVGSWNRAIIRAEPDFAPRLRAAAGLRMARPSDPVEEAFCFLCTANNHLARIGRMVRTLAEYGEPMAVVEGRLVHRFPTLERIAALDEGDLRERGFGYRGATIPLAARALAERGGLERLHRSSGCTREEAHEALVRLPGVGPKLADCVSLFALEHIDAVPVDTHVWRGFCRSYAPEWCGKAVTARRYRAVGEWFRSRFGPLAGWAHQVLFVSELVGGRREGRAGA